MSLVPTASSGSVTSLQEQVYAYMTLTSRELSRLRTDISEESAKRQFFEAYIRQQIADRPVSPPPPVLPVSPIAFPVSTGWNLAELAPVPAALPNVAEVADPIPPVTTDKDRRIAELERKVELLTEAVVSLLEMKSRGEHFALTKQEEALTSFPLRTGQTVNLWGKPSFLVPCDYITGTSDKSVCEADVTELQTATVKTDSLLTALTE